MLIEYSFSDRVVSFFLIESIKLIEFTPANEFLKRIKD